MRHTRSAMLDVLRADYVRTARAKGLLERSVVLKHALRNALVPIVTLSTLLFGELLAGAVLTEQVFTIPGFGKLVVDAVFNRDYAVVQGVVLCTAFGFIVLEPARRRVSTSCSTRACAEEPEAVAAILPIDDAERWPPSARASWRKFLRNRAALVGGALRPRLRAGGDRGPSSRPRRPDRRPASSRSARRPRPPSGSAPTSSAATCSRASSGAPGRRSWRASSRSLIAVAARRAARPRRRLLRRLGRRASSRASPRRCCACPFLILAIALGRVPRPEPDQRHDRDRHRGDADLHPPDPRPGSRGEDRGLRGGRPRHRPARPLDRASATSCRTCCRRSWCSRP